MGFVNTITYWKIQIVSLESMDLISIFSNTSTQNYQDYYEIKSIF